MPSDRRIALVYLARHAEGLAPLRRFVESYARHPAGIEHDLVIVYKGFERDSALEAARSTFAPLTHVAIEVGDAGFDIGAYLTAAAKLQHEYLCFANTFVEIAADGWLGHLHRNAALPDVGIVGATGSYESLKSTQKLIQKVRWLCNEARVAYDPRLVLYYDHIVELGCRIWKAKGTGQPYSRREAVLARLKAIGWRYRGAASFADVFRPATRERSLDDQFEKHWAGLIAPGRFLADYAQFPEFPNPHIRTNGFMIGRERLLDLGFQAPGSKLGACAFESGADSLTARLRRKGLRALVVDKHGRGYDSQDWSRSSTFRLGAQENLLLHDKQTRSFDLMPPGTQATHRRVTWGDYGGPPPKGFPDVGLRFPIDEAVTGVVPRRCWRKCAD